ncbi:RNA polymerase-associated protein RapA [Oceanospirillum sanctuarii]|uniref:RNA polymerase-associated protein RapA n=1 Tax=Oceanospirillum sanctuarii TaxID=1434821 RepID=UPI000A3B43E1|nr:RNA polymerase-associated protein RapA [Oceanospirillum sanctuarii]
MLPYIPGQRWISDAESDLGLGTILTCDMRSVTVLFPASGETRVYATRSAPLTRVSFSSGDQIESHEGERFIVATALEEDGLLVYICLDAEGNEKEVPETHLNNHLSLQKAKDRLLTGQIDRNDWFNLRYRTLLQSDKQNRAAIQGLSGARMALIPHQLYIAHSVASRYAPRVLLADEVGLGKTVEAGLILHRQWLTGNAQRILIVVPESLQNQWLVEMLRRFNLQFSLFDYERCAQYPGQNAFEQAQLVICSLELLTDHPELQEQAVAAQWDTLVVDEAHHLEWHPEAPSKAYQCIEQLAADTSGLLLLTATPEQLGKTSHFARLRLLDPERYSSFEQFEQEEGQYQPIAEAVEALEAIADGEPATKAVIAQLRELLPESDAQALIELIENDEADLEQIDSACTQLQGQLLDRHGTGRVLFRNTRDTVSGFKQRQLQRHALELPEAYEPQMGAPELQAHLSPEQFIEDALITDNWAKDDSRFQWLLDHLHNHDDEKTLLICHSAATALSLSEALKEATGLHAPAFHEGLSILERDRAAAWFADHEAGPPVLICSEIGSEGRNFQFARHLVLFDLPANPDLLEQRIGRLDRIGQQHDIQIHVPYFEESGQQDLLEWYDKGLNAFAAPCPAASALFAEFGDAVSDAIISQDAERLEELTAATASRREELNAAMQAGRDRLLERNACRPQEAKELVDAIEAQDDPEALNTWLESALDIFGVNSEETGEFSWHLTPGEHMLNSDLPGLDNEDGFSMTTSRDYALHREDLQFFSWEHPFVQALQEQIVSGNLGNNAVSIFKTKALPEGTLLLEVIAAIHCAAPKHLQIGRYLPPTTMRFLLDERGNDLGKKVSFEGLSPKLDKLKKATSREVVKLRQEQIRSLVDTAEERANDILPTVIEEAQLKMQSLLYPELQRMKALREVNPSIRDIEVKALELEYMAVADALEKARVSIEGIRVIVTA